MLSQTPLQQLIDWLSKVRDSAEACYHNAKNKTDAEWQERPHQIGETTSDIFSRLGAVQAELRTCQNYNPKSHYLLHDGATSSFLTDVGEACINAYKARELDAPGLKLFKSEVKAAIASSGAEGQEKNVALHVLNWLDAEGFNVIGPSPDKEPIERLIDAITAVCHGGNLPKTLQNAKSLRALDKRTPSLDRDNGEWVKNTLAARLDGVETDTLKTYRRDGKSNDDSTFGCDPYGRRWRRNGTSRSHPWYLKSSLVSEQQKP